MICFRYDTHDAEGKGTDMEAITIGGLAAVAVGAYYAVSDALRESGWDRIFVRTGRRLSGGRCRTVPAQRGIKKVAGVYV